MENGNQKTPDLIAFNIADGFLVIQLQDIVFCEARGSYTIVILQNQPDVLLSKNLKQIEEALPGDLFLRAHHRYLVNKLHVRRFVANGQFNLLMSNGKKVEVSTRRKQAVSEAFIRL